MAENVHNSLLACPVCELQYSLPERLPKILGCGHTFCLSCLCAMKRGNRLTCPTCYATSDIPTDGIKAVTSNQMTIRMLETLCADCKEQFKSEKCLHCDKVLCLGCLKEHRQKLMNDTKNILNKLHEALLEPLDIDQTNSAIDKIQEDCIRMRMEVINNIAMTNQEFLDEQKLTQQKLLDRVDMLQKSRIKKVLLGKQSRVGLQSKRAAQIDTFDKLLEDKSLPVNQLLNVAQEVHKLQVAMVTDEDDVVDDEGLLVEVNSLHIQASDSSKTVEQLPPACSCTSTSKVKDVSPANGTLQYYKQIIKPTFVMSGIVPVVDDNDDDGYYHIALSPIDGCLHIADLMGKCIVQLSESGEHLRSFGVDVSYPTGVAVDCTGEVAITMDDSIMFLKPDGMHKIVTGREIGCNSGTRLWGLAYGPDGVLYVCDYTNNQLRMRTTSGQWAVHSLFKLNPVTVAVYPNGTILVGTDGLYPELWKCNPDGAKVILPIVLSGLRHNDYGFNQICLDKDGHILLLDTGSHSVLVVDAGGTVQCRIGEQGSQPGQFNIPTGLALTKDGRVVVSEGHRRIQIF